MKRSPWARTISARSRRGRVIFSSVSENVGCRRGRRLCSASSRLGMACRCLGERCTHHTARTYVRIVRDFAEYFHQPPDKLGPEQIRQYQAHSVRSEEVCSCHGQSVCVRVATPEFLQHFFCVVGSRGPPFSVTQLISNPPQLPILEHAVASAAPAASYKSPFHQKCTLGGVLLPIRPVFR